MDISLNIGSLSSTCVKVPTAAINALNISNLNDFIQDDYLIFEDSNKKFRSISAIATHKKELMTPESLSRLWGIGITLLRGLLLQRHISAYGSLELSQDDFGQIKLTCAINNCPHKKVNFMLIHCLPKYDLYKVISVEIYIQTLSFSSNSSRWKQVLVLNVSQRYKTSLK